MKASTPLISGLCVLLTAASLHAAATLVAQWDHFSGLAVGVPKEADASTEAYRAVTDVLPSLALSSDGSATVNADGSLTLDGAWLDVQGLKTLPYPFTVVMTVKDVDTTAERTFFSSGYVSGGVTTYIALSANASGKFKSYWNKSNNSNGAFVDRTGLNGLALPSGTFTLIAERQDTLLNVQIAGTSNKASDTGLTFGGFTSSSELRIGGSHPVGTANTTVQRTAKYTIRGLAIYKGAFTASEIEAVTPFWAGTAAGSGTWNVAADNLAWHNGWRNPIAFTNGKSATFKDLFDSSDARVTVSGAITPASVLVDNASTDYTLTFNAVATVAGAFTKSGGGSLSLGGTASNALTGGFILNEGTVVLNSGTSATAGKNYALNIAANRGTQLTIRSGILNLGNQSNWGSADTWITEKVITLGGAPGLAELGEGKLELFNNANAIVYDPSNDAGTAIVSAFWKSTGQSGASTKTVTVGDGKEEVDLRFTGGLGIQTAGDAPIDQAKRVTLEKAGAGTMEIACVNGFSRLTISAGRVLLNSENALGKRWTVTSGDPLSNLITVNATLDLGGINQEIEYLAGNASGSITSADPATLTVGYSLTDSTTYAGKITGAVSLEKTGTTTLNLTGTIDTTGTLIAPQGSKLSVTATVGGATAPIRLGSAPTLDGLSLILANTASLQNASYPVMSWEGAADADAPLPAVNLISGQMLAFNDDRTGLVLVVNSSRYWVSGDGDWLTADAWQTAEEGGVAITFADGNPVVLTKQGSGTIAINQPVYSTKITIAGDYTLSGEGPLTAGGLTQEAETALTLAVPFTTSASVSLGENATLLVSAPASFSEGITGKGAVTTTADTSMDLSRLPAQIMPSYTVNAGTLTLTKTQSGDDFFKGAPSFTVAEGAYLILNSNDIFGWSRANTIDVATICGTLEKRTANNETASGRFIFKGNARLINSSGKDDAFMFHNNAKILVDGENADVVFSGSRFRANNGTTGFEVANASSTLTFTAPLNVASAITKTGLGELLLAGNAEGAGAVIVSNGTLTVNGSWAGGGAITVNAGGKIRGTGSITHAANNWMRGAGTFEGGVGGIGTLTTSELRPWDPGATLSVTLSEDGATCGLFKVGRLLHASAASKLIVKVDDIARASAKGYRVLEATTLTVEGGSTGPELDASIDQSQWVLVKRIEGDLTVWYLKRRSGVLVTFN